MSQGSLWSIHVSITYARQTNFTFYFSVTLTVDLLTSNLLLYLHVQGHIATKFEVLTALRVNQRLGQTDRGTEFNCNI